MHDCIGFHCLEKKYISSFCLEFFYLGVGRSAPLPSTDNIENDVLFNRANASYYYNCIIE